VSRIPDGVLPPELANDPKVVTSKAGLTPWHCRLLVALERIADALEVEQSRPRATGRKVSDA